MHREEHILRKYMLSKVTWKIGQRVRLHSTGDWSFEMIFHFKEVDRLWQVLQLLCLSFLIYNQSKLTSVITILKWGPLLLLYAAVFFKTYKQCRTLALCQKAILNQETTEKPENHHVLMISLYFMRCKPCKIERDWCTNSVKHKMAWYSPS